MNVAASSNPDHDQSRGGGDKEAAHQLEHPPPTPLSGAIKAPVLASRLSLNVVTVIPGRAQNV